MAIFAPWHIPQKYVSHNLYTYSRFEGPCAVDSVDALNLTQEGQKAGRGALESLKQDIHCSEAPSTQYLSSLIPQTPYLYCFWGPESSTIGFFGTRVLNYWVLGPSRLVWSALGHPTVEDDSSGRFGGRLSEMPTAPRKDESLHKEGLVWSATME